MEFATDLKTNLSSLKELLPSEDILTYSFQTLDGVACAILYADGMVNKQLLGELVAKPLSELNLIGTLEKNSQNDGGRYEFKPYFPQLYQPDDRIDQRKSG